ncbi:MAG: hypothetical protein KDB21_20965 [Acidimicrobiales bacterium]|nr:hypothetical protein [Acidimicrobiales bacterium]
MTDDDARRAILASIGAVAPDAEIGQLADDDDLLDTLDLDSMDVLNIVTDLHRRTGVDIPERDYGKLDTLGTFIAHVVSLAP